MPSIFATRTIVHPSYIERDLIITTAQPSGFIEDLGGRKLKVVLGPVDKFVYQNRIDVRTAISANQASALMLPSSTVTGEYISTATYRVRTRAEYSEIDIAEAAEWNVALPEAQRLAMRQGIFQYVRVANLYGVNASNNEGLLNTPGATAVNLPPDTFGNATLETYDSGQLALFFLQQILAALQRMYILGAANRIVFLGPQRDLGFMQLVDVVQTTSYQRPGAGTATTAEMMKKICADMGIELTYAYDDTLIGKGASGNDAMLLVVPEAIIPTIPGINTNEFATLSPSQQAMTLQYADVAAPIERTTPIPDGVDVISEMRISSGWCPRPEALTIISIPFGS